MTQQVSVNGQTVQVSSTEGDEYRVAVTQNAGAGANQFDTMTLSQIMTWIDSNITDANTRIALKYIARMLKYLYLYQKRKGFN